MKRNLKSILLLAFLLLLTGYILLHKSGLLFSAANDYEVFILADTADVTKIVISANNESIELQRRGTEWITADNRRVSTASVAFFLQSMTQVRMKTPVSEVERAEIESQLQDSAIAVSFLQGNSPVVSFRALSPADANRGTYLHDPKTGSIFLMYIPVIEGDFSFLFTTETGLWLDNTVVHLLPDEIAQVEVSYQQQTENSFRLAVIDSAFTLYSLPNQQTTPNVSQEAVQRYVTYFMDIRYFDIMRRDYQNAFRIDSLPQCSLSITDKEQHTIAIDSYRIFSRNNSGQYVEDYDNTAIKFSGRTDLVLMKYVTLDPLTKKLSYFVENK